MTYWKMFLTNWNVCRIVRLLAGASFMVYGIQLHELAVILFGGAWFAVGLFSMQCCSSDGCYTSYKQVPDKKEPISFDEIK